MPTGRPRPSACADGRLDAEELEERLEQTYRARIAPDLTQILHALPSAPLVPSVDPEPTRPGPPRRLHAATASYVGLNAWMVAIATDIHGNFWADLDAAPGGIGLITAWIRGGDPPDDPTRRTERDERRQQAREVRREHRHLPRWALRRRPRSATTSVAKVEEIQVPSVGVLNTRLA